ncbi:hypothetical protein PF007_g19652 [Phytophthora fragariae]|uniref:Uncharacterized protein n=2 Tax=Phytophthora fragariae TaxID=53985 RepID=A0A6A3R8X9_9STRA|nr:hypothetical protein PF003_g19734 [Phytophthora fragariae]KAE9089295.1 hypothetical protein PF007_g19652 [Phytophthora fragariae]
MVRLSTRSFLHLTPELVEGDYDQPFYAKVVRMDADVVVFRSLEGGEGRLQREVAAEHTVSAGEVNRSGRISLLRRPVSVHVTQQVQYGQVESVDGERLTIRSDGEQFEASTGDVSKVAPIIALLLEHIQFNCDKWSSTEIEAVETSILSRVLGQDGLAGSNDISTVLDGLMTNESIPVKMKTCVWIDPKTGRQTEFPLQHALDFAYYIDGGAGSVPSSVGQSFCQPPVISRSVHQENDDQESVAEAQELFDPFQDDDEIAQDRSEREPNAISFPPPVKRSAKRDREAASLPGDSSLEQKRRRVALDQDALIVDKLRGDPDWLERFLSICQVSSSCASSPNTVEQHPRSSGQSAGLTECKRSSGTSKYAFAPREDQQRVHDRVTPSKHKGKPDTVLLKGMVRSEHVKFKALPGVCTRVFDIQFGTSELSIRHFARLSQAERMSWLESGGSNFDNLSVTAEFIPAKPAKSIEEVVDAVRVFQTYAREYCCVELVELVNRVLS